MKLIRSILRNPQGAVLEGISLAVSITFLVSLAGTIFGIILFGIMAIVYESQKVMMILSIKQQISKWKKWDFKLFLQIVWRLLYLIFLICVALLASLSYSLSTIERQTVNIQQAFENAVPEEVQTRKAELESDLFLIDNRLTEVEKFISEKDNEISFKVKQIQELPPGWITASERLSTAVNELNDQKLPYTQEKQDLHAKRLLEQTELDKINKSIEESTAVVSGKFGVVASEEFTRVADMLHVDAVAFLRIFMLSILIGVEFGIILLMKPETEEVIKSVSSPVDKRLAEMDKVIDALLSQGQGKLPGTSRISELSGVSVPIVSAYRAAFIQHGFIKVAQGASSSLYSKKDLKEKARKIRDQIDL